MINKKIKEIININNRDQSQMQSYFKYEIKKILDFLGFNFSNLSNLKDYSLMLFESSNNQNKVTISNPFKEGFWSELNLDNYKNIKGLLMLENENKHFTEKVYFEIREYKDEYKYH